MSNNRSSMSSSAAPVLMVGLALLGGFLSIWGTVKGPGTNQDSEAYICGAQTLIETGRLMTCGRDWPMVWFPPLFSVMIAPFNLLGISGLSAARIICAASFTLSTLLLGLLLYLNTSSFVVALIGESLFLAMADLVRVFLYAMSEAPFMVFLLFFFLCICQVLGDKRARWLVLAGLAAGAGSLTRFTGVSMGFTGTMALLYYDGFAISVRLKRTATFLLFGIAPYAAWMARNYLETGMTTARHFDWYFPFEKYQYPDASKTVVHWFLPWLSYDTCVSLGVWFMLAILTALILTVYFNPGRLPWIVAVFALSNTAFILGSRLLLDPYVWLAERMLVPIEISVIILILYGALSILCGLNRTIFLRLGAVSLAFLWIATNLVKTREMINWARTEGLELSRSYYRDSSLIGALRQFPYNTVIYSDEPEPIYFFTGRFAEQLPMTTNPSDKRPSPGFKTELQIMHQRLGRGTGIVVYFNKASAYRRDNMPSVEMMPAVYHLTMQPLIQNQEGTMFKVSSERLLGALDCNAIPTAYASALRRARFCDLATPDSCGATRPWAPQDVCRCQVAVNPTRTAELDRLLAQFQAQACPLNQGVCNRVCLSPARSCSVGAGPSPTCTGP